MGCCLWLTGETFDASKYPQNQYAFPQSHEFSTEKNFEYLQLLLETVTSCLLCQIQRTPPGSKTWSITNMYLTAGLGPAVKYIYSQKIFPYI